MLGSFCKETAGKLLGYYENAFGRPVLFNKLDDTNLHCLDKGILLRAWGHMAFSERQ